MHQNHFNIAYLPQKCMKLDGVVAALLLADVTTLDGQCTITVSFTSTFSNTVSRHDPAYSVTDFTNPSSMTYSDPTSGTVNLSSSMFTNPSRSFTTPDQFAAKIPSAPTTDLADHFLLWDNVTPVDSVRSNDESVEYPTDDEVGRRDYSWSHTASLNDNYTLAAIGNGYDIWKPIPLSDNDNSTVPPLDNNFVFDSPFFGAHNESNLMDPYEDPSDPDMDGRLYNLNNFPFLDSSPELSPTPASPEPSPTQTSTQILEPQVSLSQMLPLQLPQSQMLLTRILSPQILQPQVVAPQALMSQLMSSRAFLLQASPTRMLPLQIISPQMLPSQIRLSHTLPSQVPQPQVLSSQIPQQQVLSSQVSQPQLLLPQIPQAQSMPLKMPPSWNLMTE